MMKISKYYFCILLPFILFINTLSSQISYIKKVNWVSYFQGDTLQKFEKTVSKTGSLGIELRDINEKELLEIIKIIKPYKPIALSIESRDGKIPKSLYSLVELEYLAISKWNIKELSKNIIKLKKLKYLSIIKSTVQDVSNLKELQLLELTLMDNKDLKVESIEKALLNNKSIKMLSLRRQHLQEVPSFIFSLKSLEKIDLTENELTEISSLLKMKTLTEIAVGRNYNLSDKEFLKTVKKPKIHFDSANPDGWSWEND